MVKKHGIVGVAGKAVDRPIKPSGYRDLAEMGIHDLTFEAVIVGHPDAFSKIAVLRTEERFKEVSKIN